MGKQARGFVEGGEAVPYYIMPFVHGESLYFMAYNGSKRGMAVNMRSPEGLDLCR